MNKVFKGLLLYLKDWRNWLTHSLIGIGLLLVALFMPVKPIYRILLIVAVVGFNVTRMKLSKKKEMKLKQDKEQGMDRLH